MGEGYEGVIKSLQADELMPKEKTEEEAIAESIIAPTATHDGTKVTEAEAGSIEEHGEPSGITEEGGGIEEILAVLTKQGIKEDLIGKLRALLEGKPDEAAIAANLADLEAT